MGYYGRGSPRDREERTQAYLEQVRKMLQTGRCGICQTNGDTKVSLTFEIPRNIAAELGFVK